MAPPTPTASTIPLFYRVFFTWLDPILCAWGASMDFFDPALVLSSHIPDAIPNIGHAMILTQRGGGMLNFGFVSAFLLRYTYDVKVWNIIQMANFIVDVTYFWSVYDVLAAQGRLSVGTWRAEDWGAIAITGTAGVVRLAFLAGVGFRKGGKGGGKRA